MIFDELPFEQRSAILASVVAPRPLAWITSRGVAVGEGTEQGVNIAPFNSYTGLANSPPLVGVAFSERESEPKDTLANIEATGEFVLNIVTRTLAEAMNESAREYGRGTDDFQRLGLNAAPIDGVSVPRIAESPAALGCVVESIVDLPPSRCRLVVARVVGAFISEGFDTVGADVLASVGPLRYASLRDPFTLPKVWG
ncbi:MAG: flavin reductase family protein [Cytophagales bacterium]|nr:flavin reductase family protein [Armatimonadota bacterium]